MSSKLLINGISNLSTLFLKLTITFVMTPIMIHNMSKHDYGTWEILGGIIGYMGFLDLGIRPAVSRFAAKFIALEDEKKITTVYSTAWFFLLAVGGLLFAAFAIWGYYFPHTIAENASSTERYTILLMILGLQLLIVFPSYTAESFMEAYQEYHLKNNITNVNSIIGAIVLYKYITPANALILLASVNAVGLCSKYIFLVWYMQFKRPLLRIKRNYISITQLKELLSFSGKTLVQGISTRLESYTDAIVIGICLGASVVQLYSVPANLVGYIRLITMNVTHAFMPYFSSLHALDLKDKILATYFSGSKITAAFGLLLGIGILEYGQAFLRLWVGDEIANSAQPIMLCLVSFTLLPVLNPFSNRYLTAINKHGFIAKWQPLVGFANLGLSLLLIKPFGLVGVALGSLIPGLIFQPILLAYCCKQLEIRTSDYFLKVLIPLVLPAAAMVIAAKLMAQIITVNNYVNLIISALTVSLAYLLSVYLVTLNQGERTQFLKFIKNRQ